MKRFTLFTFLYIALGVCLTAIAILDDVLKRMEAHQLKKTPQLRALHSW